jgi:hypothetical protein
VILSFPDTMKNRSYPPAGFLGVHFEGAFCLEANLNVKRALSECFRVHLAPLSFLHWRLSPPREATGMQPFAILQTAPIPSVTNSEKSDGANQPTSDTQSKRLLTPVEPVQNTARSQLAGTAGALRIKTSRPRPACLHLLPILESRIYEIRPRKDDEGLSLRCEAISMRLWFMTQDDAISYARHRAEDGGGIIRVYGALGDLESEEIVGAIPVR